MAESVAVSILLLEDSPFDVFLLRTNLSRLFGAGLCLLHAERLADALRLLRENAVDVILTDLNVPDSFGIDTVRALVSNAGEVPVVALAGDMTPELEAQLRQAGISGQISKDEINTRAFVEVIDRAIHSLRRGGF